MIWSLDHNNCPAKQWHSYAGVSGSCEQYRTKIVENAISTEGQALDVSVLEAAHTQQRNPG